MSYHIVQKIKIDKEAQKVYVTGADNNVYPRTPEEWHCSYYDNLAQAKKWDEIELDILSAYDSGNFQGGRQNKYTRALQILRRLPDYSKFDWRNNWDEYTSNKKTKEHEYKALLRQALNTKLPKDKFVISRNINGVTYYLKYRKNSGYAQWVADITKAKTFHWLDEAQSLQKCFTNSDEWQIQKIA